MILIYKLKSIDLFILGFLGAYKNRLGLLQIFIGSLFLILLLQLIAAIVAFTLRNKADTQLHDRLLKSLPQYKSQNSDVVREWDNIQQQWSCCGVNNASDWTATGLLTKPPNSCCLNNDCSKTFLNGTATYFGPGCYDSARSLFFRYSRALGGVTLFFFFVEIIGLVLAVVLLRDLKNNYGSV